MVELIGFLSFPLGIIGVLGLLYWNHRSYVKWYDHPDTVRERQKDAYDAAHAYLGGRPCCGRDQTKN